VKVLNFNALYAFDGYVVEKVIVEEVGVQIKLRFDRRRKPCCPKCGEHRGEHRVGSGLAYDLPIVERPVLITYPVRQVRCRPCGGFQTVRPAEVHPSRGATWRLMRTVSAWASVCPASAVATMFAISDSTVRRYDKAVLEADLPEALLDGLVVLLVDEKAVRKRHGYVTVVLNGRTGELLHMTEGKKKQALVEFLDKLTAGQKASIRAVCIDRNGAYKAALSEHLPDAEIVHDLFHLMMNLNEAIDRTRRAEWHQARTADKKVIKGSRYLLLKGREKLDDKGLDRLVALVKLNEPLTRAYILKESFRDIFRFKRPPRSAQHAIGQWCSDALNSGLPHLMHFAKGVLRDIRHVVAYFTHNITSGLIEAFNNQIARVIHRACGMTDLDYLTLKMRAQSLQRI
jgi:transposase